MSNKNNTTRFHSWDYLTDVFTNTTTFLRALSQSSGGPSSRY
ncbi:hypothetical protein GGQ85_002120 [Nitrobacter vulgaris]|nr:hypothetical protein [Nitrobacter vulgaris]